MKFHLMYAAIPGDEHATTWCGRSTQLDGEHVVRLVQLVDCRSCLRKLQSHLARTLKPEPVVKPVPPPPPRGVS